MRYAYLVERQRSHENFTLWTQTAKIAVLVGSANRLLVSFCCFCSLTAWSKSSKWHSHWWYWVQETVEHSKLQYRTSPHRLHLCNDTKGRHKIQCSSLQMNFQKTRVAALPRVLVFLSFYFSKTFCCYYFFVFVSFFGSNVSNVTPKVVVHFVILWPALPVSSNNPAQKDLRNKRRDLFEAVVTMRLVVIRKQESGVRFLNNESITFRDFWSSLRNQGQKRLKTFQCLWRKGKLQKPSIFHCQCSDCQKSCHQYMSALFLAVQNRECARSVD